MPIKFSEDTTTSLKEISEALNPSTVGKFSFSMPSAFASTRNKEIPFSSTWLPLVLATTTILSADSAFRTIDFFPFKTNDSLSSRAEVATSSRSNLLCSSAYANVTCSLPSIRSGKIDCLTNSEPPLLIAPPPSTILAKKGSRTNPFPNCSITTKVSI